MEHVVYLIHSGMRTYLSTPDSWVLTLNDYMRWQRGTKVPETTIKLRSYHLRRFALTVECAPFDVDSKAMLDHLANREWSAGTARSVRTTLRSFYGWAHADGAAATNPAWLLPSIAVPLGKPRPASEEAVRVGLTAADSRVRLMMQLGMKGLRCREIALVHSRDVHGSGQRYRLLVHGKGGRERYVGIPADLARALLDVDGYTFPGQIDGHLSAGYISKLLSRAMQGLATGHRLRHRFGTRALREAGGNLRIVQELLGHASVATTQVYTAVDDDDCYDVAIAA